MRIAYQGEPGAYSEAAAQQVNAGAQLLACRSFEDVFEAVNGGPAHYGVLPIENSIGGSIHRNFDLLLEHELPIVGEVELPVVHHLLAMPGTTMAQVKRIYSHPQAIAQCDRFLRSLTGVEVIATYDTAGSAKLIADEKMPDAAAIASARAAEVFGLQALQSGIQDYAHNTTRFLVIGRRPLSTEAPDKTTIVSNLNQRLNASPFMFITDYTGLKVDQFGELRNRLHGVGAKCTVVKNTLLKRAAQEAGLPDLGELKGQTAIITGEKDVAAAAKVLKNFTAEFQKPTVKAGVVDRLVVGKDQIAAIADLPSREVLLSQLLGVLQAPASKLVRLLNEPASQLARVLKAKAEKDGGAAA
jgi:prephenate dehydratase